MFGNFLKKNSRLSSFRYMSSTVDITIKWQNISSFHHHRELNIFFKTVQFGEAELLIINNFWNNFKLHIEEEKYFKLSRFLHLGVIEQNNCVCYLFFKTIFPFFVHCGIITKEDPCDELLIVKHRMTSLRTLLE